MTFGECENVNLRMNLFRRVNANLELSGCHPFDELFNAALDVGGIIGVIKLVKYYGRNLSLRLSV